MGHSKRKTYSIAPILAVLLWYLPVFPLYASTQSVAGQGHGGTQHAPFVPNVRNLVSYCGGQPVITMPSPRPTSGSPLDVPLFSQREQPWCGQTLGHNTPGHGYSVASYGCVITSLAMIFDYYSPNYTDPGQINRTLTARQSGQGFDPNDGNVDWGPAAAAGPPGISVTSDNSWSHVNSELAAGHPVLAWFQYAPSPEDTHAIVLTAASESGYVFNDPWDGQVHRWPYGPLGKYDWKPSSIVFHYYDATVPTKLSGSVPGDGAAIKSDNNGAVYLMEGGAKFLIPSAAEYFALGFSNWNQLVTLPAATVNAIPTVPRDGTLIRERGQSPVFVIRGRGYRIPGPADAQANGLDLNNIKTIPYGSLGQVNPTESFYQGSISANPSLVSGEGSSTTISWNTGGYGGVGQVWVDGDNGEQQFASSGSGTAVVNWMLPGHTYVFKLFARHDHTQVLASVTVTARGSLTTGNLLSNASWEHGTAGWVARQWNSSATVNWTTYANGSAKEGGAYLETNTNVGGSSILQDVSVAAQPGQSYTFSVWARVPDGAGVPATVTVALHALGGTEEHSSTALSISHAWTLISVPMDVLNSGHTALRAELYIITPSVNIDFDGAQLINAGLSNASWEHGFSSWNRGIWVSSPVVLNWATYTNPRYAKEGGSYLETNTDSPGHVSIYQDVSTYPQPGQSFTFSVWARIPDSQTLPGSITVSMHALGGQQEDSNTTATLGHVWRLISVPLEISNTGHAVLRAEVYLESGGNIDLDGAQLVNDGLSNASWERGFSGWHQWEGASGAIINVATYNNSGYARDGNYYLESNTNMPGSASIFQDIANSPSPGQSFTFSVWARIPDGEPVPAHVALSLHALGGQEEDEHTDAYVGHTWTFISVPMDVVNSGHSTLRAEMYLNSGGNIDFDGASLAAGNIGPDPSWAAEYTINSPPPAWKVGQTAPYSVSVVNAGSATWPTGGANPVHLGIRFTTKGGGYPNGLPWATDQRFTLPMDVPPGASATIAVNVTAPSTPGSYALEYQMVHEYVAWFDQYHDEEASVTSAAPTITGSAQTAQGSTYTAGTWTNQAVTVTYRCTEVGGSIASCPAAQTFNSETGSSGVTATGTTTDSTGATANTSFGPIKIDMTPPTITATARTGDGSLYTSGRSTTQAVTVYFTCSDALSGVATCPSDVTFTQPGQNQSVTGTAVDTAGNRASVTMSGIDIVSAPTTGSLTVSPNPVPLTSTVGTTILTYSVSGGGTGQVYVSVNGSGDVLLTQGNGGSVTIPWISPGFTYVFTLYTGTGHSTSLAHTSVTAQASPVLTASPNPVSVAGALGNTTITFSTGDGTIGQVYVSVNGGTEILISQGAGMSFTLPWIALGNTYTFTLYSGTAHTTVLKSVIVSTQTAADISASPNPVSVAGALGTTTITYSTGSGSAGQVYVSVNGGADILISQGAGGTFAVPWIVPGNTYVFTLYAGTTHSTAEKSVTVTGQLTAGISASPNPVTITGSLGSTTLTFSTGNGTTGQIYVALNGGPEVLVAQGAAGSITIPWIARGSTYTFTLYAGTTHTTVLAHIAVTAP